MTIRLIVGVALLAAWPQTGAAQAVTSAERWAPWLGCWDLRTENLTDGEIDPVVIAARQALPATGNRDIRICVTPTDTPGAIRQQTIVNDKTVLEEIVAADGVKHPVQEAKCQGSRTAEWSTSGRQLFTKGTLACDGQPTRDISGITMMVVGPTWLDVQLVDVGGQRSVRIRRYGLARDQSIGGGRTASRQPVPIVNRFSLDEVTEASRKVEAEVLQAALVEVGTKFPLNRERLLALDKAGVPGSVVDVMVALTFPEKFVIDRPSGGGYSAWGGTGGGFDPWGGIGADALLGLYSPWAYQYYGYYPSYGSGWGWIPINPIPPVDGGDDPNGRVVNGQGYTRVTPRQPAPPTRVNAENGDGGVVDRSGSSGSNGGSDSGSSGGVSSGGYSGGSSGSGSGSGSGRTAQPRPPGGGR